jgi:hypothetical protein
MKESRINLEDSLQDMIMKMGGGNPGAITVLCKTVKQGVTIDPDCAFMEMGGCVAFDSANIYEHRIWMLYKDVCDHNLVHTLGILRARQLGFLNQASLDHAIDNRGDGINVEELVAKVQEQLPKFGKTLVEAEKE